MPHAHGTREFGADEDVEVGELLAVAVGQHPEPVLVVDPVVLGVALWRGAELVQLARSPDDQPRRRSAVLQVALDIALRGILDRVQGGPHHGAEVVVPVGQVEHLPIA